MSSSRAERVSRQLLRETTAILKEDLKDPRIGFVTVTRAEVSADLQHADIFVSILGNAAEQEATFEVLAHASGFVRTQIGRRMRLRFTPEIRLVKDDSGVYVDRILEILQKIKTKETPNDSRP